MPSFRMSPTYWALLLLLSVAFGAAFFFMQIIVTEVPPLIAVGLRTAPAALVLWAIVLLRGLAVPRDLLTWGRLIRLGFAANLAPFFLLAWGQTHITSGLAAVLNATTPLWGVLFAQMMTRDERATPGKIAGVLTGVFGVAVIMGPALFGAGDKAFEFLPALACVGAACFYAYSGVYGRRLSGWSPLVLVAAQLTVATVVLVPVILAIYPVSGFVMPSGRVLAAVAGASMFSTAFGFALFFYILKSSGATNVLLVTQIVPVTAILLGALFLGEQLEMRVFAGMALIACGFALVDGRVLNLFRRPRPLGT